MNNCLVTYIESDVFDSIVNESIKQRFQNISTTKKKETNLNTNKFLSVTLQYYNRGDENKKGTSFAWNIKTYLSWRKI